MSTAYCHPADARADAKTIDGWIDDALYGADIRLELITTSSTGFAAGHAPGPFTGFGGAVSTFIGAPVFASLESAAASETGLVSAFGVASGSTTAAVPLVGTTMDVGTATITKTNGRSSSTPSTSAVRGTTLNAAGSSSAAAAVSPAPTFASSSGAALQLCLYLVLPSLVISRIL